MATVTTSFVLDGQRKPLAGVPGITEGPAPYAYMEWELNVGSIPASGAGDNQRWQVQLNAPDNSFYALTWATFHVLRGAAAVWTSTNGEYRVVASNLNVFGAMPFLEVLRSPRIVWAPDTVPGFLLEGGDGFGLFLADNGADNQPQCFLDAYVRALVFSRDQAEYWPPHTPSWTR